jgi:hypothetical protein
LDPITYPAGAVGVGRGGDRHIGLAGCTAGVLPRDRVCGKGGLCKRLTSPMCENVAERREDPGVGRPNCLSLFQVEEPFFQKYKA